jgi:crossover junction endodeoxyribonuclease RuvC
MIRALLGLTETPPPDAADAIAIGLTHFQTDDPLKNATGTMTRV